VSEEELRRKARERAEEKLGFYIHLAVYIFVNSLLVGVWWFTGGNTGIFPWFIFPLIFWGLGLALHALTVFIGHGFADRMAEKEYQKLKEEQDRGQS
jgi:hypothetical protein